MNLRQQIDAQISFVWNITGSPPKYLYLGRETYQQLKDIFKDSTIIVSEDTDSEWYGGAQIIQVGLGNGFWCSNDCGARYYITNRNSVWYNIGAGGGWKTVYDIMKRSGDNITTIKEGVEEGLARQIVKELEEG